MTDPIRIVIPMPTPSLNQTHNMHWAARRDLGTAWGLSLLPLKRQIGPATGKRRVTIERVGTKLLDQDNLVGGVKGPLDQIKKLGLILDDNAANLELEVTQRKCAKGEKPHTVVVISDAFQPPPCP